MPYENPFIWHELVTPDQRTSGSLLVAWMLTLDDGGRDGRSRSYLEAPEPWSKYDPDLFAGLTDLLRLASQPSVSLFERTELLPRTHYHAAVVPDGRLERDAWRNDLFREVPALSPRKA